MTNRNSLLGRSKPREKLTREEIAALDEATVPPAPPAKPPGKKGGGPQRMVRKDLLKFHWSLECPGCGFKLCFTQNPGKVMDDITFVHSYWWLVSEGFSLLTANSDVQKLPATQYHRMADSLACAA